MAYFPSIIVLSKQETRDVLLTNFVANGRKFPCTLSILDRMTPEIEEHFEASMKGLSQRPYFLYFSDTLWEHPSGPTPAHVEDIRRVARELREARVPNIIVHCHAGVSRSTAALLTMLAEWGVHPIVAAEYLLNVRPCADPNPVIFRHLPENYRAAYTEVSQRRTNALYARETPPPPEMDTQVSAPPPDFLMEEVEPGPEERRRNFGAASLPEALLAALRGLQM